MRNRKRRLVQAFSVFSSLLMILSLLTPGFVQAVEKETKQLSKNNTGITAQEKLSKHLLEEFVEEEKVTFLVKFKEKADTMKVSKLAKDKAEKEQLTAYQTELKQRSAVVSELKATSLSSQENVKEYLDEELKKGTVDDVESYYIVNALAVTANKKIAEQIASFPEVEKLLPNERRQLIETDKEQLETALENIEWNVDQVQAPEVWERGVDGSGVVVASIDSGVQWDHPALMSKYRGYNNENGAVSHEFNWFDPLNNSNRPDDTIGHGTHVTGTMVGAEEDGTNQIGVAPGAKWIAVKAFNRDGATDTILLRAAQWLLAPLDRNGNERVDMAPDIINNSWGGGPGINEFYRDVVINWRAADIFPVFSAGNTTINNPGGPGSIATPANYPESFAVGATDRDNQIASFSLLGPSPYGEIKPDIVAPGVSIRSAEPGSSYGTKSGTSMSAPAAAGVLALVKQVAPDMSIDEIEEYIFSTATPLTDNTYTDSPNNAYGYGLINAYDSVIPLLDGLGYIEGQVTTDGEDSEPPTFEHTPVQQAYPDMNLDVMITARDDISITSIELKYKTDQNDWNTVTASLQSGDHQDGEYVATVPGTDIQGETLTYQWIINDFGQNTVTSEEYTVPISSGVTIGYFEDFESEPVGWTTFGENNSWEWGVPTSGPESAASGEKVYGTNLSGNHPNDSDAWLMMPAIDLPVGGSFLQFKHWYHTEYHFDFAEVMVSTDQENWESLARFHHFNNRWEDYEINLSEFSGQRIYVAFALTSDSRINNPGWYIDDVAITDTSMNANDTADMFDGQAIPEKLTDDSESGLPLSAHVSVLETGYSAISNSSDGGYSIRHIVGDFTVKAEAYGYESVEKTVSIVEDEYSQVNFHLDKINESTISGMITNEVTGSPISGATVLLVEDANVTPVTTDENGNYEIIGLDGTYTMKILANGYRTKEIEVVLDGDDQELSMALVPINALPGEVIGYDDGTAENARAHYEAGDGWGVRMSLPAEKTEAIVSHGMFQFDEGWPSPGGNEFAVEVWSVGLDGKPGSKIAGPIEAETNRDGNWTIVDLREHDIVVTDDFYMVYIQSGNFPLAPGLATDESSGSTGRSYEYYSGMWSQSPPGHGNFMIRSQIADEVDGPVIVSPTSGTVTNETSITVEGTATPDLQININNNGTNVATTPIDHRGYFSRSIELSEGENDLRALTLMDDVEVNQSEPVTVTLDTVAPEVTIDSHQDGDVVSEEIVTIDGTVTDLNLDYVTVNGDPAEITDDKYSRRIIVENGEQEIEVVAIDRAGNSSSMTISLTVDFEAEEPGPDPSPIPVIEQIEPKTDQYVQPGDEVPISFTSDTEGGEASFSIKLPNQDSALTSSDNPMTEVEPGVYEGTWNVSNLNLQGAVIEVAVVNAEGIKTVKEAEGKIYISSEAPTIENLQPESDQHVKQGESIEISFTSDTVGGEAQFMVQLSSQNSEKFSAWNSMEEIEPGVYQGTWTMPDIEIENGIIAVEMIDPAGNKTSEEAEGRIFTQIDDEIGEKVERISSSIRYDTAIEISKKGWEESETIILARGDNYADALAGVPLAHKMDAPILITRGNELWSNVETEIARLGAENVIILGGTGAISKSVETELVELGLKVERIAGSDRFETAALIAAQVAPEGASTVAMANGTDFPDALSIASHAAQQGMPILLTRADTLPEATETALSTLQTEETIVVGGYNVIEEGVKNQLPDPTRLRGTDRYETNIAITEHFGNTKKHMYVATGRHYADALTGAVLAAKNDSAILLVPDYVPDVVSEYIIDQELNQLTIFGGTEAVSDDLASELEQMLQ